LERLTARLIVKDPDKDLFVLMKRHHTVVHFTCKMEKTNILRLGGVVIRSRTSDSEVCGIGGSVIAADCGVQSPFIRAMGCHYLHCAI